MHIIRNKTADDIGWFPEKKNTYCDDDFISEIVEAVQEKSCLPEVYTLNHRHTASYSSESSVSGDIENEKTFHNEITSFHSKPAKRIPRTFIQAQKLKCADTLAMILSSPILLCLLIIALIKTIKIHMYDLFANNRPHDNEKNSQPEELVTNNEIYYAEKWGYKSEKHYVVTKDGYILCMYRLSKKGTDPTGKRPLMIGHGLFQCSGAFVLNEEHSMAFQLVEKGYDVWMGNNRAVGGLEHISLSHSDPEYWDWGLKELGIYDFTAMIDYVREKTEYSKIAYIGHSQGNAQVFIALSQCPELAEKLSIFVALAPAIFSGSLANSFPLKYLVGMNDWLYSLMFGSGPFLSIMTWSQSVVQPHIFCFLAYSVYSYLFDWWDHHWVRRRKAKYFQFTPRAVSVRLISDWIAGWGRQGICRHLVKPANYNVKSKVPLVIFYGNADYLVDGEKFVRTFPGYHDDNSSNEYYNMFPMLELIHVERIEGYEHMDTVWAYNNRTTTYPVLFDILNSARWS